MRVGLLTAWANRTNGGVFEAVVTHAAMLLRQGMVPHVFALAHPDDELDRSRFKGIEVTTVPVLGPNMIGFGTGMGKRLKETELDLLHLHGMWTHVSADGAAWAQSTGRPYVISPHGMCGQWTVSRGRLKKAVAMTWFERRSWNAASVFHALTDAEADDIAGVTGHRETAVIPNGIAICDEVARPAKPPTMLCVARIHPVKNLVALVEGWRLAKAADRGWWLVLAGWGSDADVAQLMAALGDNPQADGISFIGPAFGKAKEKLLANASFVVLPSLSEALPMGILEAWASGVPSVMSDVIPLPEGFASGAAIGMGTSASQIALGLQQAMALDRPGRELMAKAARTLAIERFSTEIVADRWTRLYTSLTTG